MLLANKKDWIFHFNQMSAQPSIFLEPDLGTMHPLCTVLCLITIALAYEIKSWMINQNEENMDKIDELDRKVGF